MKRYLEHCEFNKNLSKHSLKLYKQVVRDLSKIAGTDKVEELRIEDIYKYSDYLKKKGVSDSTVKLHLVIIKTILNFLKNLGVQCLPSVLIDLPTVSYKKRNIGAVGDIQKMEEEMKNIRDKAIFAVLKSSGMRISELVSLKIKDIEQTHIPIIGKGGKTRLVFISDEARELIKTYLEKRKFQNSEWLFTGLTAGKHITTAAVQKIFREAGKKMGIKISPHMIRHSFATKILQSGCPINKIQELLGHSSIVTTSIYLHSSNEELYEVWKKGQKSN